MKRIGLLAGTLAITTASIFGCSSNSDSGGSKKASVQVVAKGLSGLGATQIGSLLAKAGSVGANSVSDPDTANGEYEGMGVATSGAKVDSLKIFLNSVSFGTKIGSEGTVTSVEINQELDIADGVNTEVTGTGELDPETYSVVGLSFAPRFKIKAYAYFDTNNDGNIDTTVYTTADEIKKVVGRLDMSTATDYAEYEYKFLYIYCSSSPTNSEEPTNCGNLSILPEPVTIEAETSPKITVLITSFNTVFAWTGLGVADGYVTSIGKYSDLTTILG